MNPRLHRWILIGALLGAACGLLAHYVSPRLPAEGDGALLRVCLDGLLRYGFEPAGLIFRNLLLMLAIPLIFSALVFGVVGFGDLRALGRIGAKTFGLTLAGTAVAVLIGVGLVTWIQPGVRTGGEGVAVAAPPVATGKSGVEFFVDMVPKNPLGSAAAGDYLAMMVFALLFGVALARTRTPGAARLKEFIEGLWDVSMTLIGMILYTAPIGVFALLYAVTAKLGWTVVGQLGWYVLVVVVGLAVQMFLFQGLLVRALGGMGPIAFFRAVGDAMLTAFSTSSSNATLPTSLRVAEENLKLPPAISRFVLTIGATANQHGTALFEGVTVLFLAQFYGIELSLGQQLLVVAMSVLGGIGAAGVPSGSLPFIAMILERLGIPGEGIGVIFGVDRFLDMCRTVVNVTGDLAIAVVVSKSEQPEQTPISRSTS